MTEQPEAEVEAITLEPADAAHTPAASAPGEEDPNG